MTKRVTSAHPNASVMRIMHAILPIKGKGGSDWGYSWVPIVGPIVGGMLAGVLSNVLLP